MSELERRVERLERRVERERRAREEAERLLEAKSRELWSLNQSLEARVAERTVELERAKAEAESASEAKSLFLASVSHELRTPMTAILGASNLVLEQGVLEPEDADRIRMVETAARNLLVLINDILDLSKLASGTVSLRPRPTEVGELVEECTRLAASGHLREGVELRVEDHRADRRACQLDPDRVRQLVLNLVGNAMKFTTQGEVRVELGDAEGPEGAPELALHVIDTGPGIPADQLATIFEPFVQTAGARDPRAGTGLGLPIARRLAEVMGGRVEVRSRVGEGSRFSAHLPAPRAQVIPSAPLRPAPLALAPGLSVFLVEDNAVNALVLGSMLEHLGCRVDHAPDGESALERFDPDVHHLVLLDRNLPGIDGLQTARRMRASHGDSVPIVALTGNASNADKAETLEAGMNDHASKPIELEGLQRLLSRWDPRERPDAE